MSTPVDPLALALRVGDLLDRLEIPYVVGGAVAAMGFQLAVYLSSGHPFEQVQFQRALVIAMPDELGGRLRVASAADTILAILEWYTLPPSDRQWRDVQAVLRVQDETLDRDYLRHWAEQLGITVLTQQALSGQAPPPADTDPRQLPLL